MIRNKEAERLSRLGFIFTYALGSWQNRPDYFEGSKVLVRFGKECDHVLNGGEPHDQQWMDDPNGAFWDALPTPEPNGYTAQPEPVVSEMYAALIAAQKVLGNVHATSSVPVAHEMQIVTAALAKANGGNS